MPRAASLVLRLAAAALVVAAAGVALPAAPATAATCSGAHGVTVVVDFHELGGGAQTACVANGGGRTGDRLFEAAHFSLSYVARQPGFVCKVAGKPSTERCQDTPPANAYWALYWSTGKGGKWSYASSSVGGLKIPDGGSVAFSWSGSNGQAAPGVAPPVHASTAPSPTKRPTQQPTRKPTQKPAAQPTQQPSATTSTLPLATPSTTATSTPSESATESAEPSATSSATPTPTPTPTSSASPSDSPSASALASSDPAEPDGGLPTWVGPAVLVVLFGAGGAAYVVRRRRTPH